MKKFLQKLHHKGIVPVALIVAVLIVQVFGFSYQLFVDDEWSPLCESPTAEIFNKSDNGYPRVKLGDDIVIRGTICNDSDETVHVVNEIYWTTRSPPRTSVEVTPSTLEAKPGKHESEYVKVVPPTVITRTKQILENGKVDPLWVISGTTTPYKNGKKGVPIVWETRPFRVAV